MGKSRGGGTGSEPALGGSNFAIKRCKLVLVSSLSPSEPAGYSGTVDASRLDRTDRLDPTHSSTPALRGAPKRPRACTTPTSSRSTYALWIPTPSSPRPRDPSWRLLEILSYNVALPQSTCRCGYLQLCEPLASSRCTNTDHRDRTPYFSVDSLPAEIAAGH